MELNELQARLGNATEVPGAITPDDIVPQTGTGSGLESKPTAFKKFLVNDVVQNQVYVKTNGLWSNNSANINTFYTSSAYTATQKQYYLTILSSTSSCNYQEEFYISYGDKNGSGSLSQGGQLNDNPSRAIYSQFKNILLQPEDAAFSFPSASNTTDTPIFVDSDSIYVISFNQKNTKDKIDPGNWELYLSPLTGSALSNNFNTSSALDVTSPLMITLVDNSGDTSGASSNLIGPITRPYYVYSGSLDGGIYTQDGEAYGLFYPDYGVIVLNAKIQK
jgi:hypothetical protein